MTGKGLGNPLEQKNTWFHGSMKIFKKEQYHSKLEITVSRTILFAMLLIIKYPLLYEMLVMADNRANHVLT